MTSLLNLYTNQGTKYRSIPYGDGQQPYVTVDINTQKIVLLRKAPLASDALNAVASLGLAISNLNTTSGNLITTGTSLISRAAIDVNRIGNFLADPLKGPLFLAQQEGVQAMNVRFNLGDNNTGAQLYNPLSPIIQTAINATGGHIKRTLDSLITNILGKDTYEKIYFSGRVLETTENPFSALLSLTNDVYSSSQILGKSELYSYNGGPDSFLGLGQTTIYRYQNTPLEQKQNIELNNGFISEAPNRNDGIKNPLVPFNIVQQISGQTQSDNPITYANYLGDKITVSNKAWKDLTREVRIGSGRQDSINLTPLFSSTTDNTNYVIINGIQYTIRDLAKFRIEAIDSTNPLGPTNWMVFRAYITRISDSFNGEWNGIKYIGRGENFFSNSGFSRGFNISFRVAALSEAEMIPMYQKLNYLASNMSPQYVNNFMTGPFMRMTVGNWLYRQPGIITNLSYSIPDESPWEIALNEDEKDTNGNVKKKRVLYELPHIINVDLTFIPVGVGRDAVLPQKGESSPFILFKPHEGTDPIAQDNIWLTNYYNTGKADNLTAQIGKNP